MQLDRQSELHQQLYTELDKKYYDAQNTVAILMKGGYGSAPVHEEASEYIVQQIKGIQDQVSDFTMDNEELRVNYTDLQAELDKLQAQKEYYLKVFSKYPQDTYESSGQAVLSLRRRIYELLDLSEEMKHYSTQQEVLDLEKLIFFLEEKLQRSKSKNNKLAAKIER